MPPNRDPLSLTVLETTKKDNFTPELSLQEKLMRWASVLLVTGLGLFGLWEIEFTRTILQGLVSSFTRMSG